MHLFEIRDECRKNLNKYTLQAFSFVPAIDRPLILDAGCGTGVPSLALIEACNGSLYAVDPDKNSLDWFKRKIAALKLEERITLIHDTTLKPSLFSVRFDIILAEGLLNVIGFEKGLKVLTGYLQSGGYIIIHDELKDDLQKRRFFDSINLKLVHSFELHENVWIDEYFLCLKSKVERTGDRSLNAELQEIEKNISHPENVRSIYYILHHETD